MAIENDNVFDDLDTSWLDEFENLDKEYKDYYTEELLFIRCHFVYINKTGEIEKIREQTVLVTLLLTITIQEISTKKIQVERALGTKMNCCVWWR